MRATPAEWRVLTTFLRDGGTNGQIANRLHLREDTVKSHMKHLLAMTGQPSRTALVVALWRGRVRVVPNNYVEPENEETEQ